MFELALSLYLSLASPDMLLDQARQRAHARDFEGCQAVLRLVHPTKVSDQASYYFYKGITAFSLSKQAEAQAALSEVVDGTTRPTDRHWCLATLMLEELREWKANDLGAIARQMEDIGRNLQLGRAGKATQQKQQEVLDRLDALIRDKEAAAAAASGKKQKGEGEGEEQQPFGRASTPQNESQPAVEDGPGQVDPKTVRGLAEHWGKLPDKDRARILTNLRRQLPPAYQEAVESYLKKIEKK